MELLQDISNNPVVMLPRNFTAADQLPEQFEWAVYANLLAQPYYGKRKLGRNNGLDSDVPSSSYRQDSSLLMLLSDLPISQYNILG